MFVHRHSLKLCSVHDNALDGVEFAFVARCCASMASVILLSAFLSASISSSSSK
jgi:hypothetical protein